VERESRGTVEKLAIAGVAALVFSCVYARVLLGGQVFATSDALRLTAPFREFLAEALKSGRLPEWYDRYGLGAPLAGNPLHGVTNPVLWLLAVLPQAGGYDVLAVLCVACAALGVAALARELGADALGGAVAALLFGVGGYVVSVIPNASAPMLAWTPWVAWAVWRVAEPELETSARARRIAVLAAVFGLQLMSGEPAQIFSTAVLAVVVAIARKPTPRVMGALAVASLGALAFAALALVPGLVMLSRSTRALGLDAALSWSLHPLRMVETIWAGFLGDVTRPYRSIALLVANTGHAEAARPAWSGSVRLGIPALALAAIAATRDGRARVLLGGAGLFLLLALGRFTPVYPMLRDLAPPVRLARFPEKHFAQVALLIAALAGVGLTRLRAQPMSRRAGLGLSAAVVGLALLVATAGTLASELGAWIASFAKVDPRTPADVTSAISCAIRSGAVEVALSLVFVVALFVARDVRRRALALLAAAAALVGGAVVDSARLVGTAPKATAFAPSVIARALAPQPGRPPPRVWLQPANALEADVESGAATARYLAQEMIGGMGARFGVAVFPPFDDYENQHDKPLRDIFWTVPPADMLAFVGADAAVFRPSEVVGIEPVATTPRGNVLFSSPWARPRAFVATRWSSATYEDVLRSLSLGRWDRDSVAIPDAPVLPRVDDAARWPCAFGPYEPDRVELDCASPRGGYAVLLDAWAPGWSATVGGRDMPVLRADGLFRAVALPPGRHAVVFTYRTPGLSLGAGISALTWALIAALLFVTRRRGASPIAAGEKAGHARRSAAAVGGGHGRR
jgi:hypothetical protein